MKKILILGCGWVAEDLAVDLLSAGHQVWATTTQSEKCNRLIDLGIHAVLADFDTQVDMSALPGSFDYVLTSVPASSRIDILQTKARFEQLRISLQQITYDKHIYLSSIGVYPDIDFVFKEDYDIDLNARLLVAEKIMLTLANTVVYRLGGLFGKGRIFAKYFENKPCTTGDQIANFVHVDDVVTLINKGFTHSLLSTVYNIVAPEHPSKKEVILASAKKYNFVPPTHWVPKDSFQKIVNSTRIIQELDYTFKYPNPLSF